MVRELSNTLNRKTKKIFLDLKFHDIPNTVTSAVFASLKYETDMVNMHTQGGPEMMSGVVGQIDEYCDKHNVSRPLLIGVTLLTSLDENYLNLMKLGFDSSRDYVLHLAEIAKKKSGLNGVVSSAQETPFIKKSIGNDFITVTPGIRPAAASVDDQKRVVTPKDAKDMGTDFIVIGRPVTKAEDPKKKLQWRSGGGNVLTKEEILAIYKKNMMHCWKGIFCCRQVCTQTDSFSRLWLCSTLLLQSRLSKSLHSKCMTYHLLQLLVLPLAVYDLDTNSQDS